MAPDFSSEKELTFTLLGEEQPSLLWGDGARLIFVLYGSVSVLLRGQSEVLSQAGFCLVNPLELCRVSCASGSRALMLTIPQDYIHLSGCLTESRSCTAVDAQTAPQTVCDELRRLMAQTARLYFNRSSRQRLNESVMALLQFLESSFPCIEHNSSEQLSYASIDRITYVLNFIHHHWAENISVAQLAEQIYVSPNYLSRFFSRYLHTTITDYISNLRIQHALRLLREEHTSITETAMRTGFPNTSTFIRKFKQQYGLTPKQFEKQQAERGKALSQNTLLFTKESEDNDLSSLFRYLPLEDAPASQSKTVYSCKVSAADTGTSVQPMWRRLLNFGYAREGLLAAVQQQISRAQRDIGFEYIRFHGIFDDNMQIYQEDEAGQPKPNFLYADMLTDFLVSQGFKLYIELGLMPSALKKYDIFVLNRISNFSVPAQSEKWHFLIVQTLRHWISRYGQEIVRTWRFTVMGIHVPVFTDVSYEEYYEHYRNSWEAVKSVDPGLQFGGPGGFASIAWDADILPDFFRFTVENGCFPDFITTQNYPHHNVETDAEFMHTSVAQDFLPTTLSGDRHFTRNLCGRLCHLLRAIDREQTPIWLEECNSTIWQRDLSGDTCYKAAWLCHSIAENYAAVQAFGYWLLTDFIEERGAFTHIFHGGYGLFTYNGVLKAGWQALCLLRRMGDALLAAGDWYLITRSRTQLHILLFHYCDYDSLYRHRYRRLSQPAEAYRVFREDNVMEVHLEISRLTPQPHQIQRSAITREQGSSFDQWLRWGAPNDLSVDDISQLHLAAQPSYRSELIMPDAQGVFHLQTELQMHEVQLFTIELNS